MKHSTGEIFFGALANQTRFQILKELENEERCVNDLVKTLKIKQSLVSHNLKLLIKAGLVRVRRAGTFRYYVSNKRLVQPVFALLDNWLAGVNGDAAQVQEHDHYGRAGKSSVHMFLLDKDGMILVSEGRGMETAGYISGVDLGKHFSDQLKDMPEVVAALDEGLKGNWVDRRVSGRGFIFALKILPRFDEKGRPAGCIGAVLDIKAVLELEWKLRESEEWWRSLVINSPFVIVAADLNGRITYANRSLSGGPVDQIIGKNALDFFTSKSRPLADAASTYVLKTGETRVLNLDMNLLDGSVRSYKCRVNPIMIKGKPGGLCIAMEQI